MKFFRNSNPTPAPAARPASEYRVEYVPMSLPELEAFARILLGAERAMMARRSDLSSLCNATERLGTLYERAGAASLQTTDADRVRIPLQKEEIHWLEIAVRDLDFYKGSADLAHEGRHLLWRLRALLGRERAVINAGGTPMFDPTKPTAVVLDDDEQPTPADPSRSALPWTR
ncbi:hypothetical protein [Streptomyces sp. NPDC056491]|uniref:hypothetical protein n=1 Tax=Streptomyces sp. NPDC056491 TaxID=3345837 RepID=UPI00369E2120